MNHDQITTGFNSGLHPSMQQSSMNTLIAKFRLCFRSHQRGHPIVHLKCAAAHRSPVAPS